MTTDRNPLGNFLGAARDSRERQQAFDNEITIQRLQLDAQSQMAAQQNQAMNQLIDNSQLANIAGMGAALGGIAGGLFGGQAAAGTFTQQGTPQPPRDSDEAARARAYADACMSGTGMTKTEHVPIDKWNRGHTIREILQAEIDLWLAPVTI